MTKIRADRLLKLASYLENDANYVKNGVRFDLSLIATTKENSLLVNGYERVPKSCVTAGCAIGCTPLAFPYANFSYFTRSVQSNYLGVRYKNSSGTYTDFNAAMEFFCLDSDQASYLFEPEEYPKDHRGRKSVARRIRAFVRKMGFNI